MLPTYHRDEMSDLGSSVIAVPHDFDKCTTSETHQQTIWQLLGAIDSSSDKLAKGIP